MGHAWPCSELVVLDSRSCMPAASGRDAEYHRDETNSADTEMEVLLHNRQLFGSNRDYGRNIIIATVRRTCRSND